MSNEECSDGFCVEGSCKSSIIPKYLPTVCDTQIAESLVLATAIDTSDDASCDEIVAQGAAPDICVVHANTIVVNGTVSVTGDRALALVADGTLTIEGTLDASGNGAIGGPGASSTSGGAASATSGGGGAGQQTAGAPGGKSNDANGGLPVPDPAQLSVLVAGASATGAGAGGGGGAVTLISCRGKVSVVGLIDAGGGGGAGGTTNPVLAGQGGGSGGYVVLQGVTIEIIGQVFANGGAGGGGQALGSIIQAGTAGDDGSRSATVRATGGKTGSIETGGGGGIGTMSPQGGDDGRTFPNGDSIGPGGGGGSVGFLQTHTPPGATPEISSAEISPMLQNNRELSTK